MSPECHKTFCVEIHLFSWKASKIQKVGQNTFTTLLLNVDKRTLGNENKKENDGSLEDFWFYIVLQ